MNSTGLVTVIVPVYNAEKYLVRCLDSILCQTYCNLEIILVDDGSCDQSGVICDEYAKMDARIKVIHKENAGVSAARNTGLDVAKGDYIGFVDSDDYIEPEMYESMMQAINDYDADISCVGIIGENEDTGTRKIVRCPKEPTVYDAESALQEILLARHIGIGVWSKMYRREVFEKLRFPVGETNEEAAILMDMLNDRKLAHTAKPMYHYMRHKGSLTSAYSIKAQRNLWINASKIKEYVVSNYPKQLDACEYYLAFSLYNTLVVYQSQNAITDENVKEYFREYKRCWRCLLRSPYLSMKLKIKCIAIRFSLFKMYYAFKNIVRR